LGIYATLSFATAMALAGATAGPVSAETRLAPEPPVVNIQIGNTTRGGTQIGTGNIQGGTQNGTGNTQGGTQGGGTGNTQGGTQGGTGNTQGGTQGSGSGNTQGGTQGGAPTALANGALPGPLTRVLGLLRLAGLS
jgi:hypothetical protein